MILVDTSVFVDHLRGQAMATKTLGSTVCAGDRVSASVLTKVELLWATRADEKRAVRDLLDAVDWLPVTDAIAEHAGALARRFRASHRGIDVADYVIGATAAVHEARLWTCNVRHFPMFEDLEPPY